MAVDIKVAPDEKLELVQTYITDTNSNSDYFNISELPETFSGGKNAFLLAGSDKLLANTEIKIQIRDSEGKVCYIEYSNGSPEYYEGNSKVVAVYVYPNTTAFGPATITILGQLKDVPQEWNGLYSVKWTKQININPALANTTRVRFYKRPQVSITEIVEPLYTIVSGSKTPSLIQGSFASIKVNQLETFAGDVKRIKVYRTALGDISDYDLIQDILVESKNLLTTYELSGSVVGDGGVFTNDSLSKLWLTGSLYGALNSTYINDGLQLTGSGNLTYSTSLNLLSSNTYELQLDSFFTGSTANNLGIYVSYPTQSTLAQPYIATTQIATLNGSTPTKNFGTQTFPFNVPFDYPTASLYLSQSSGTTQWHVGNISLNVSQDTAFSPNEISFITSMPTVLTNETFNFKFEFYDVNNNYVPVAVTQSAVFVGGTNFNTLQSGSLYASSSVSASLAALSQSVSGTISLTSQSVSSSIAATSSSLSSSISKSASDTSASSANFIILVSGSLNDSIDLVSGSVVLLSSSLGNLSSSLLNFSSSQSSQSLYQVYSASAFLDKFIFTDENGKLNSPPTASGNGLYLGSTYLGYYSQSVWRTYMDDQGDFYLTGSNNNFLAWSGQLGTLQVQGVINIQGGNAATTTSVADVYSSASAYSSSAYTSISASNAAAAAYSASLMSSSLYISASLNSGISGSSYNATLWSASLASSSLFYSGALSARAEAISSSTAFTTNLLDGRIFTDVSGNINRPPNVRVGVSNGLYLGSNYLGFYSGSSWRTYMDDQGKFYLTGSVSDGFANYLTWDGAGGLTVAGNINIVGANSNIYTQTEINTISASISASAYRAYLSASSYSSSLSTTITTNSGSTLTSISASNAASLAYSASISASTAATTALLDGRIFTDANGRVVKAPTASVAGLFLGNTHLGFYDGSGTWKTYMDNSGKFYLTGSSATPFSNYLVWDGAGGLTIAGAINITGGNGATQTYASGQKDLAIASGSSAISSLSGSIKTRTDGLGSDITTIDDKVFTNALGRITKVPTSGSTAGLYLGSTNLGYYNGTSWRTYMDNTGLFYLTGSAGGNALLWDGSTLSVKGTITVGNTDLTEANTLNGNTTKANVGLGSVQNLDAQNQAQTGLIAGTTITGGGITLSGGGNIKGGQTAYNTGTGFFLGYSDSLYRFSIGNPSGDYLTYNGAGTLAVGGTINATAGAIGGWNIGGNKIYVTNKLELDAGATYPSINVYDSGGTPRVVINNSPTLSSLTGGGAGSGTYAQTNGGNSTAGTIKYFNPIDMSTVNGAVYNLAIAFTESDSTDACNFSPNTSTGNINWGISIWNTALSTEGQSVYSDITNTVFSDTFWSWSDLGGINGIAAYANVTGDGTTLKIRPFMRYNGSVATCRDLTFPEFSYSWVQTVSKTEIIPGGMQVVNSTAAYLIADRVATDSPSTPWMTSAGNWKHNGVLITNSDRNIKSNIIPIDFNLEKLNEIDGYSYDKTIDYDGDGNGDVVISTYGIIAQEIETILPNAVSTNASDGIKGVDYNAVTGMLLSAVKKLYLKVVELENRISGSI